MNGRALVSLLVVLSTTSGCGNEHEPIVETHALGNVDAYVRTGETSFSARYVATLDDESCEVLDERSGCVLTRCTPGAAAPFEDAGEVVVGSDALDIAEDGSYSLAIPTELVPGESLGMQASGSSAVPAHDSEVVVPNRATVTAPELAEPLVLDPTLDFVVDLAPVESDRVVVSVTSGDLEVSCLAAGLSQRMTVAADLLTAVLAAGDPATFRIVNENLVDSSVSGWRIWFGVHQVVAEGDVERAGP